MNRPPVVNFNNGICAESVHRESNPNSQVYPDGGPQRSVRIHYIPVRPHISQKDSPTNTLCFECQGIFIRKCMYFRLLGIFTFSKSPPPIRRADSGQKPGGPM